MEKSPNHKLLLTVFSDLLGSSNVLTAKEDTARYYEDCTRDDVGAAMVVLRPSSTNDVAEIVKLCSQHNLSIIPQGGNTGLVSGAVPHSISNHVLLSMERMNDLIEIDEINFSVKVSSGCVLETVKQVVEKSGFIFPLSLGAQGSCQIGGNVATNAGGINVLRYGMMRELVLGIEVVLPDGQIWNAMHALRKDNRGIDLKQLFIGSEGMLGIVTAVTLKLFPKPEQKKTVLLALESVEAAVQLFTIGRRDCSDLLTAFELIPHDCLLLALEAAPTIIKPFDTAYPYYVLLEVAGSQLLNLDTLLEQFLEKTMENGIVLDGVIAASESQANNLWMIREAMVDGQLLRGKHLRTDVSVPISKLSEFVAATHLAIEDLSSDCLSVAYGHIGDGNIHFNVIPSADLNAADVDQLIKESERIVFNIVDQFAGSISAEHGIGRKKRAAFLERLPSQQRHLLQQIKQSIDPHNRMNPGCILPD